MTPYLVTLLEMSLNNAIIPSEWNRTTVVPTYKGGDRSAVTNYRPISLTSVGCKYLRQVWGENEGEHGFRLGYSCEVKSSQCTRT
jgi:hypothetical protein